MRKRKFRVRTYRDRNRPHLRFVVNYREDGKRRRSFFETKIEATTFAQQQQIKLTNKGREGAEFSTSLRIMAQECAGKLAALGATLADATKYYISHRQAVERSCTVAVLVDEVISKKTKECGRRQRPASEDYVADLKVRLGRFSKEFGKRMVATITSLEIEDWLSGLKDNRTGADLSPLSRGNYARALGVAFSYAVKRGYATANPVKKIDKPAAVTGDIGILTVTEAARLLESATTEVLPYIAIGLFAGLRRAELQRLDWSEIDFDDGLIKVTAEKSKTAQKRFVTMQPNLREWLQPVRKHKGKVTPDEPAFRRAFEQARKAAGITSWPDNALRHSFASYHLAHFKNAASTALEMGHHDSRVTFAHYRELVKPKEADRYWNIRPAATAKIVSIAAR
jgi:integrase